LGYSAAKENAPEEQAIIDRAIQTEKYFNKDIDPRLKNLYLQQGGYGLLYKSGDTKTLKSLELKNITHVP
jgi:hypothetical protein